MNVSELARRLKITINQLHEVLPQMGIDVGRRAVKIDDRLAQKVLRSWSQFQHLISKPEKKEEEQKAQRIAERATITLPPVITVRDFAQLLNIPVNRLIQTLMNNGILAALNEKIDYDSATIIAEDLGFIVERHDENAAQALQLELDPLADLLAKEHSLSVRPPIVVVIGHVDHGKTSLLDAIRSTNVVSRESGGITQHIGAYQTTRKAKGVGEERLITFIDTPGHEAFITMRSRGAKVADIAILVIAADDGVKPQTVESIKIIKAARLPIVVAINKIDKPSADIDRVKRELSDHGLIPEDWSGTTICVPVSAKTRTGIEDLLDMVLLVADMEKEKIVANPDGQCVATVIESHIDKHEGPIATLLVQNGTLRVHDYLSSGITLYGKARSLKDWRGQSVDCAPPSMPIKIIGLKNAPIIGYMLSASPILDKSLEKGAKRGAAAHAVVITPTISAHDKESGKAVKFILKTDTLGSLEAIATAMTKIEHPEVKIKIVAKDLGTITTTDILSAEATGAFVAGFHVSASTSAAEIAREKEIEIKSYKIIYELIDDIKARAEKLISPDINRIIIASARVIRVFRTDAKSMVIGARVEEGTIEKGMKAVVVHNDAKVTEGKIGGLKSGKQDIAKALSGSECGIQFDGKPLIKEGDLIKTYRDEEIKRTLEDANPTNG